MMKDDETRKLFNEFPPISTPEWEQAILKDLKGADYAKKLIWTSPEGIQVKPYYRAEDLEKLKSSDFNPLEFGFLKADDGRSNSWFPGVVLESGIIIYAFYFYFLDKKLRTK